MTAPIDLATERERRNRPALYACECGCSMFRCWSDGKVECLNCAHALLGLVVVDEDVSKPSPHA